MNRAGQKGVGIEPTWVYHALISTKACICYYDIFTIRRILLKASVAGTRIVVFNRFERSAVVLIPRPVTNEATLL